MRDKKDPFSELRRLIQDNPDRVTILEEEIDIKLQMEFYRLVREAYKSTEVYVLDQVIDELFDAGVDVVQKKRMLVLLASTDEVAAFRAIERYREHPDNGLEKWALMAYQSSRVLISSQLLGDVPLIIATGLGGQGRKLRYSIGLAGSKGDDFSEFQRKIILSEMGFLLKSHQSTIESSEFHGDIVLLTVLIPLEVDVSGLLDKCITAINQFGSFLKESFLITNMLKITAGQMQDELLGEQNVFNTDFELDLTDDEE